MSIILKGIDLPKEDEVMVITVWGDDKDGTSFISNKEPMIVVPINAIQIPKGHGRLIDADALETIFKDMAKCEWNQKTFPISWAYAFEDTIDEIYDAPTILEAEE